MNSSFIVQKLSASAAARRHDHSTCRFGIALHVAMHRTFVDEDTAAGGTDVVAVVKRVGRDRRHFCPLHRQRQLEPVGFFRSADQHFALLPHRTVLDNAAYPLEIQGVDRASRREKAAEARVPMVQDIPLARALHASCEIGQEVPKAGKGAGLFGAAALIGLAALGALALGFTRGTGLHPTSLTTGLRA